MLLINLFFLNGAYAQKCEVENDAFTNKKVVSFNYENKMLYFERKEETITFSFQIHFSGKRKVVMPKGTKVLFKLENDETFLLTVKTDATPIIQADPNGIISIYMPVMDLQKEHVNHLSKTKVDHIRYSYEGRFINYKGNRKWKRILMKGAECISEHL